MSGWDAAPAARDGGGGDWGSSPVKTENQDEGGFQPFQALGSGNDDGFNTVNGGDGGGFGGDDGYNGGGDGGDGNRGFSGACRVCEKEGHRAAECPDQVCRNCSKKGHHSRDCTEPVVCRICSGDHQSSACPQMVCRNCSETGHGSRACPNPCGICKSEEHKSFDCPDQKCNFCDEKGHVAKDCPKKAEIPCRNCLEKGHAPKDCTAPRREDMSGVADATLEEAWDMMKTACDESDLDSFKEAFKIYTKACPEATLRELQTSFVDQGFKYIMVAVEKEIEISQTVVDLQGNQDKKYVVTFQTGLHGRRKRLAKDGRYPATPEENMERLGNAGFVKESFIMWCSNCHEKGHGSRSCPQEVIPKEDATPIIKCVNCNEVGHRARDCDKERKAPRDPNACRNCGALDHIGKDCPEPRNMENVQCRKCEKLGHAAKDCPDQECRNCGGKGHSKFDCPEPEKAMTCNNCGEDGHMRRDCPKGECCRNCNEEGHQSRECPRPRNPKNVTCNKCNEKGHFARDCTASAPEENDNGAGGFENKGAVQQSGAWGNDARSSVPASNGW